MAAKKDPKKSTAEILRDLGWTLYQFHPVNNSLVITLTNKRAPQQENLLLGVAKELMSFLDEHNYVLMTYGVGKNGTYVVLLSPGSTNPLDLE